MVLALFGVALAAGGASAAGGAGSGDPAAQALLGAPSQVTATVTPTYTPARPVTPRSAGRAAKGYWLTTAGGQVLHYGAAVDKGGVPGALNKPVVGIANSTLDNGYWLAASDGGVFAFGLPFEGSAGGIKLNKPVVGIAADPGGSGYWLVASDGGIFNYGTPFEGSTGSIKLNKPIVGMAATPSGNGYWLVASDGGVFAFGDAGFLGSMGSVPLNKPIVGMAATQDGAGYWLVASDGGIFSFGDAAFYGSAGSVPLVKPVVGMAATPSGKGYWLAASDGGVFSYGDAAFFGSAGGHASGVIGMAPVPNHVTGVVSVFYYGWYGTPSSTANGGWLHWDEGGHSPPTDIGSTFYPTRGAYSSTDTAVIDAQMAEIAAAGINQIVFSWWGQGTYIDQALTATLPIAAAHGIDVAIHLEPYVGRTASSVTSDIPYLMAKGITEFYVYDTTQISANNWALIRAQYPAITLFATGGASAMKAGLLNPFAVAGGFDGIYTYDPYNFSGSDFAHLCTQARANGLLCAPSVAPGYDATRATGDTRVRSRSNGATYDSMWSGAISAAPDLITITSYNEWHEGSQIEPAQPFCIPNQGSCYEDYSGAYGLADPQAQTAYLARTAFWAGQYRATETPTP
ncbi:MAG TPA: hypothetical protein VFW71_09575 [Actinomycetota bacterium]|nr:hypothetical protein [Actinomycetota bacterium]